MAAPSIAAGYPNSDSPSSGKKGDYSYDEAVEVIARSGAEESIRNLTLAAFAIRGHWPKKQGPVSPVIYVSVQSLVDKSGVYRSTVQRRIQRAMRGRFWRKTRDMNIWLECPKCGAERESAQCPNQQCGHKGNGRNPKEFRTTVTYAVDLEMFERTPPCRHVQQIRLKKAEVRQMPSRHPAEPTQAEEPIRKTTQHQRIEHAAKPKLSKTECSKFVADVAALVQRSAERRSYGAPRADCPACMGVGSYASAAHPGESLRCGCTERSEKLNFSDAVQQVARAWKREPEIVAEALKFWGYSLHREGS
jgi:hypothetical protein